MIEGKNLSFYYDDEEDIKVVNDVDIKVKKGEFLVILGHNGSGKSTISKHFNSILTPKSGTLILDGYDALKPENIWDIRSRFGMVFQNPDNQIVATIVEEDVAFAPENLGIDPKEIRKRVDDSLERVNMSEFKESEPHMLSGGQKQRVAIAGILAMRPECIILDEPTAMLDPVGRKDVIETVIELNKNGITIVLITHNMEEAIEADRIIVMDKGKFVLEGTPKEVFSKVDVMKNLGLDVPDMTSIAYSLKKNGFDIEDDLLSMGEMVDALCQLKSKM